MGRRALERQPTTPEDIKRMCDIFADAMKVGAFGIATSTTAMHRSSDDRPVPTLGAAQGELAAFVEVLRREGRGVLQWRWIWPMPMMPRKTYLAR